MKQADFYILAQSDEDSRRSFLCKLINRILSAGHQVYIYCNDEFSAQNLSNLLWDFRPQSFLANSLISDTTPAPIRLGWSSEQAIAHREVLVNLSREIPSQAAEFTRVVEIVIQHPEILQQSRERYKSYRDNGFKIQNNDMRSPRPTN